MNQRNRIFCHAIALTFGALCLLLPGSGLAQSAPTRNPAPGRPATAPAHPHQEPCWQVAGISKSAMEQRRSIMENTRSQVEAVCADSSLTQQQRHEKIRQIHEQAKQQADALVTPQQIQELKSCQMSRNHGGGHPGGHMGGGHGPCGELPAGPGTGQAPTGKPEPNAENDN